MSARIPEFQETLRALCIAAFEVLARPTTLPPRSFWRWTNDGPGRVRCVEVTEPDVGALLRRRHDELVTLGGWKSARSLFKRDGILARHVGAHVGVPGGRSLLAADGLFEAILTAVWDATADGRFRDEVFDRLYPLLEDFFVSDTLEVRLVAPLQNVANSGVHVIADDVRVEPIEPVAAARIERPGDLEVGEVFMPSSCAFTAILRLPKGFGTDTRNDEWPPLDRRLLEHVEAARAAFEALAPGRVSVLAYAADFVGWAPIGGATSSTSRAIEGPRLPEFRLDEESAPALARLWRDAYGAQLGARPAPPPPAPRPVVPPQRYVAIHRANLPVSTIVGLDGPVAIGFHPGPLALEVAAPKALLSPNTAAVVMGVEERILTREEGPYAIFETTAPQHHVFLSDFAAARLAVAEAVSVIDLRYPGLLLNRVHEGAVSPGTWAPEGPMRLTARPPDDPEAVLRLAGEDLDTVNRLGGEDRRRFQLAARWHTRGLRADNVVDRLLYLWTALEVHPARNSADVPGLVGDYLLSRLKLGLEKKDLLDRLRMAGPRAGPMSIVKLRCKIVHDGVAFVPFGEDEPWNAAVDRLEAIVATCLRLLAGLDAGHDLDRFLAA